MDTELPGLVRPAAPDAVVILRPSAAARRRRARTSERRSAASCALRRLVLPVLAAVSLAATGCAPGTQADRAAYRPDLAGTWVLDPASGNDSSALALALADSADPRLRPGRFRRPGGSDWPRDSVYRPLDPVRAARLALAAVREPPPRITIGVADTMVTFRFEGGQDVALSTRWQPHQGGWGDDRNWRLRARWREGRLEVERAGAEGSARLREFYSRSPSGDRLVVWTVVELSGDELTVRRVYRLADTTGSR
jgi:hypothetical protein